MREMVFSVLFLVLFTVDIVAAGTNRLGGTAGTGCRSLVLTTRGGSTPKTNATVDSRDRLDHDLQTVDRADDRDRDLNMRSDDFYLEHDNVEEHSWEHSTVEASPKNMLLDNDIFYDAVDYESASSIYSVPKSRRKTKKMTAPDKTSSFLKIFRVFSWKGFGFSCEKSIIQWNSFGIGLRVPVSSNFPEWDRNSAIPKLSTSFGLNYPKEIKFSVTSSVPVGTAIYGLMLLGKNAGGFSSSVEFNAFLERMKKQKTTDSIKRIGVIATIRYTESGGVSCYIGPWGFYYPGYSVMQHLLPMIFSVPAVFLTLLGLLFNFDGSQEINDLLSKSTSAGNATTATVALNSLNSTAPRIMGSTQLNKTKSAVKNIKKKSPPRAISLSNEAARNISNFSLDINDINTTSNSIETKRKKRKLRQPKGVVYWHNRILKWAATKTTGLGYNMGMKYKSLSDASLGSRIIFEIQSFYPFPQTMAKLSAMSFSSFQPFSSFYRGRGPVPSSPSSGVIPNQIQVPHFSENHIKQAVVHPHPTHPTQAMPTLPIPTQAIPHTNPDTPHTAQSAQSVLSKQHKGSPHGPSATHPGTTQPTGTHPALPIQRYRNGRNSSPSLLARSNENIRNYGSGPGILTKTIPGIDTQEIDGKKGFSSSSSDPRK